MSTHGPSHERPWAPAELDALEDRLEHDDPDALPWRTELSADDRDRVRARARQYQALQQYTRRALDVAPPASVLAAVMQEARASCAVPTVAPTPATAGERAGLWARIKRAWWIPTLATAGAGALAATLVVRQAEPAADAVAQAPASAPIAKADAPADRAFDLRRDPAIARAEAAEPVDESVVRGDGLVAAQAREADAEAPAMDADKDLATALKTKGEAMDTTLPQGGEARSGGATASPRPKADARLEEAERKAKRAREFEDPAPPKPATSKPSAPAEAPSAPPRGAPGSGAGGDAALAPAERLARGDAARRRNDCGAARSDYLAVIEIGVAKQRARARAGLALCAERSGAEKTAAELMTQARADDPGIDAWVADQRSSGP